MTREGTIIGSTRAEKQFGFTTGELDFRAANGAWTNTAS